MGCVAGLSSLGSPAPVVDTEAAGVAPIYVNRFATGSNTGNSWADALTSLSVALERVQPGQHVWVAEGKYSPDVGVDADTGNPDSDPRAATFWIRSGTKLYGGFAGHEASVAERAASTRTVLSGEIGDPSVDTDNSYHVVFYDTNLSLGRPFGVLDGFVIRDGVADGPLPLGGNGAGLLMADSNRQPTEGGAIQIRKTSFVKNTAERNGGGVCTDMGAGAFFTGVTFRDNHAGSGGGVYMNAYSGSLQGFLDCTFEGNGAVVKGGALCRLGGAPASNHHIARSVFHQNKAGGNGGAIFYDPRGSEHSGWVISDSLFTRNSANGGGGMIWIASGRVGSSFVVPEPRLRLVNNTIAHNSAVAGGAIFMLQTGNRAQVKLENSILWENTADIYPEIYGTLIASSSLFAGAPTGNLSADPEFIDPDNGNYQLHLKSPARAHGEVALLPVDGLDMDLDSDRSEPIPLDLLGRPRFDEGGTSLDLGAYEHSERLSRGRLR